MEEEKLFNGFSPTPIHFRISPNPGHATGYVAVGRRFAWLLRRNDVCPRFNLHVCGSPWDGNDTPAVAIILRAPSTPETRLSPLLFSTASSLSFLRKLQQFHRRSRNNKRNKSFEAGDVAPPLQGC